MREFRVSRVSREFRVISREGREFRVSSEGV